MAQPAAVYRDPATQEWRDCEILGVDRGGYVVRETGKLWPGVALTPHVRIPAGVLEVREYTNGRSAAAGAAMRQFWELHRLPVGIDRWKYRILREVLGREAALAALAEQTANVP